MYDKVFFFHQLLEGFRVLYGPLLKTHKARKLNSLRANTINITKRMPLDLSKKIKYLKGQTLIPVSTFNSWCLRCWRNHWMKM